MRQRYFMAPTQREASSDAEAASHKLLLRAGYIRQLAAGVYTYLPLGLRVLRRMEAIIREEMERAGGQELLMPAMQPAELWHASGRYDVYGPELIRLSDRHGREFALGPTHEEVITTLVKQEIGSYRKLPFTLYQIQTKFRDERRPRFGLLRGREFLMKDAYSFDADWEGLDRTYRGMYEAYIRIFERTGLNFRAVEADSGSIGGDGETHEFMALADIGEDTIVSCTHCRYAANIEIALQAIDGCEHELTGKRCPRCGQGSLRLGKGIELGHVFKLGTRYSQGLQAVYLDSSGTERPIVMGCYGIGISRMLAAAAEQHHDEAGIRWPLAIAPFRVHVIPVSMSDDAQATAATALYERLTAAGVEALLDDRDERPGIKFKDADLIGIPIRIVVGKTASDSIVGYKERVSGESEAIGVDEAYARILHRVGHPLG